jgi:hypothetical protein
MKTCSFADFMHTLDPWLNDNYIRKAYLDGKGNFTLLFVDGGGQSYQIDDCTKDKIDNIIEAMKKRGIPVDNK